MNSTQTQPNTTTDLPSTTRRPVPDGSSNAYAAHHEAVYASPLITDLVPSARYTGETSTDEGATWTPVPMPAGWDTVCGGHVQAEVATKLLAGYDVAADGPTRITRDWDGTLTRWTRALGLVTGVELPDYLTAPAVHHGALSSPTGRSLLARTGRSLISRALDILNAAGVQLAGYTDTHHCVIEGAHVVTQTLTSANRVNVILELATVHFDHLHNPRNHPGYPSVRAARVRDANRWADLFRAQGWAIQEAHGTTPDRLAFVMAPPSN